MFRRLPKCISVLTHEMVSDFIVRTRFECGEHNLIPPLKQCNNLTIRITLHSHAFCKRASAKNMQI